MTQTPPVKKPYVAPTIKTYGSLTQLTHAVGAKSHNADGGTMGATKTS